MGDFGNTTAKGKYDTGTARPKPLIYGIVESSVRWLFGSTIFYYKYK